MRKDSRIFVAGHRGLVGSAICRNLSASGFENVATRSRDYLDLCDQRAVGRFFEQTRPEFVFLAAAKVGGILANSNYPADFIAANLLVQVNVIDAAWRYGVKKLLCLGSSCIYPKYAQQPIREEYLLTGELEPTNEPYAIAKIAGIKMAQAYSKQYGFNAISLMPTNLYGPGDNFDPQSSHVLPALIRKFHEAKVSNAPSVTLWGSGTPKREFLHVDDLASAAVFLMREYNSPEIVNVGCGEDISIHAVAKLVARVIGYTGEICLDTSKPDGTPRKLLDITRLKSLGWEPSIGLETGIRQTYQWYTAQPSKTIAA